MSTASRTRPARYGRLLAVWAAVSVVAAVVLVLVQPLTPVSPDVFSLVMLAPGIGVLVAAVYPGLPADLFPGEAPRSAYVAAKIAAGVAVLMFFAVLSFLAGEPPAFPTQVSSVPILAVIAVQLVGAFSEEIGFRGVLQHTMYRRLSIPVTGVLVGLIFGLWHVQNLVLPVSEQLLFIAAAIALNVTYTYLMVGNLWQRMVVATIVHAGMNLAIAYTGVEGGSMGAYLAAAIVGGGAALAVFHAIRPAVRIDAEAIGLAPRARTAEAQSARG